MAFRVVELAWEVDPRGGRARMHGPFLEIRLPFAGYEQTMKNANAA